MAGLHLHSFVFLSAPAPGEVSHQYRSRDAPSPPDRVLDAPSVLVIDFTTFPELWGGGAQLVFIMQDHP